LIHNPGRGSHINDSQVKSRQRGAKPPSGIMNAGVSPGFEGSGYGRWC
jgi:hypothetical protein